MMFRHRVNANTSGVPEGKEVIERILRLRVYLKRVYKDARPAVNSFIASFELRALIWASSYLV